MSQLVVTSQLALRVGRSEVDHMKSWLDAIGRLPGNPFTAESRKLGKATALFGNNRGGPSLGPLFNRVLGPGDGDIGIIDEAIRLYAERGLPCRLDLNPYAVHAATMRHLAAAGFCPYRHHDHLVGPAHLSNDAECDMPDDLEVREVGEDERADWAEVWQCGFLEVTGIEEANGAMVAEATSKLASDPGWTLFLAYCGGVPAGAAALYVQDGIGSLALAGTDPRFRGRGCQTALLRARIKKASELNCEFVAAQAALGAQSHRNMQRAGLRIAYTRAFWIRPL